MDTTKVPLGVTHGPVSHFCDADEIVAFALAINDDNPRYLDGSAVPPTYAVTPGLPVMLGVAGLPPEAAEGMRGGVHGQHDIYLRRPITPGMTVHTTAERVAVTSTRAGMLVFPKLTSVDDDGNVLVEQYWSTMYMGEVHGEDQGETPPDHTFPDEARDRRVGTMTLATTRDQTFRYAGASGDRAVIHVSDVAARAIGFPKKFNQGLCTLGLATKALVALGADGDPSRVTRLAVQFRAPMFPGDDLVVSVYDVGGTPGGGHAYAFEAESNGQGVLRHGRLEVAA